MSAFAVSQALIAVAFLFDLASFQFREKNRVLVCLCCASLLIAAHFWLLETYTAAIVTLIAAMRFGLATVSRSPWLMFAFLGMIAAAAVSTYSGLLTLLVSCSASLSTWGAFRADDRRFRQVMMVSASIMVLHNVLARTPAGVILELFFLASNLVGYYRHYLRKD